MKACASSYPWNTTKSRATQLQVSVPVQGRQKGPYADETLPQIYSSAEFATCKYLSSEIKHPSWAQVFILCQVFTLDPLCVRHCARCRPQKRTDNILPPGSSIPDVSLLWSPPSFLRQWRCLVVLIPSRDGRRENLLMLLLKWSVLSKMFSLAFHVSVCVHVPPSVWGPKHRLCVLIRQSHSGVGISIRPGAGNLHCHVPRHFWTGCCFGLNRLPQADMWKL